MMRAPEVCIYHDPCADGFTAAWAVWRAFGNDVAYVPGVHGEPPADVAGKRVVIVDFSYKRPVLIEMAKLAESILILDHHKSAEADLSEFAVLNPVGGNTIDAVIEATQPGLGNLRAIFDMGRSGAQLAWDFFHPGRPRPDLVDYVADRDLWRFKLPSSRAVNAWLWSYPYKFVTFEELARQLAHDQYFPGIVAQGEAIDRRVAKDIAELIGATRRMMVIGSYSVPVANLPYTMASEAAGIMAAGLPFAAAYFDRHDEKRVFSLRSRPPKGIDVSAIAKLYGGGGHVDAAGFEAPLGWEGDLLAVTYQRKS